jgi:glycerol-3-phosphate dehydrogenase
VLFPVPTDKGKGILVSQTYWGNLILGPTARDTKPTKGSNSKAVVTNAEVIEYIVSTARSMVSDIDLSETITSFAGLRARSNRGDFIIEMSCVPGFVNVAGIDSPGLTSSPAIAEYVVEILRQAGQQLTPNPTFNANRSAIIIPKGPSFDGAVDDLDPHKNVICRCEKVTEAEIVDCISHRPFRATTVDAIKKRTRAGMGTCQGKFCGERVAALIARETHTPMQLVPRRSAGSSLLPANQNETEKLLSRL